MATRRYGIAPGEAFNQVTEAVGAATASDPIEITVDLAVITNRVQIVNAIDAFKAWILAGNWPPA